MILVVCGPPGVGKTTIASRLQHRLRERDLEFEVLDSDAYSTNTYERLFDRVRETETNWLVAGTFYQREWQVEFTRLDAVVFVHLRADLETCLERNREREDAVSEEAVHVVWREFDDPDADLVVDVRDRSPEAVVDEVLATIEFPEPRSGP